MQILVEKKKEIHAKKKKNYIFSVYIIFIFIILVRGVEIKFWLKDD